MKPFDADMPVCRCTRSTAVRVLAGSRGMRRGAFGVCATLAIAAALAGAEPDVMGTSADDQPPTGVPVLVLTTNLKVVKGRLTSLDFQSGATLTEPSGKTQRFEPSRTLALVAADPAADATLGFGAYAPSSARAAPDASLMTRALLARTGGLLTTTFGERVTGTLRTTHVGADQLGWFSERLGNFDVALDRVSSVRIGQASTGESDAPHRNMPPPVVTASHALPAPGADDAVVLRNGDTVRGLVTRVDSNVVIEGEAKGAGERTFTIDRVEGVVLANPRKAPLGQTLWLADGSVLLLSGATTERTGRGLGVRVETLSGGRGVVPLAEVRAWTPTGERFAALSSLEMTRVTALGGRVHAPRPMTAAHPDDLGMPGTAALGASDIVLLGGVEGVFTLPRGARRFVGTVALEDDAAEWGDCEVVVDGGKESGESALVRLNEGHAAEAVNIALGSRELTIRVEPGRFGTVKDRVRVMRGLVLLAE